MHIIRNSLYQHSNVYFINFIMCMASMGSGHSPQLGPQCRYDRDRSGFLDTRELSAMAREVCPAARPCDCLHLARLLDLDGNRNVTLSELEQALVQGGAIEAEVCCCQSWSRRWCEGGPKRQMHDVG